MRSARACCRGTAAKWPGASSTASSRRTRLLSTAHGRDTVTISLHYNAGLPFDAYFNDIEPIFRAFGGRPHWGKKHSMKGEELRPLFPK